MKLQQNRCDAGIAVDGRLLYLGQGVSLAAEAQVTQYFYGHENTTFVLGLGFQVGVVFHRVIPDFVAQTGDPTGTGSGGSDLPDLTAEISSEKHKRGTVSAARTNNPKSANSQSFVCFGDAPWLDRQYSIWG